MLLYALIACDGASSPPAPTPPATISAPAPAPVVPAPPQVAPAPVSPVPASAGQLLLVRTPSWDAVSGTASLLTRTDTGWAPAGPAHPIVVGRNGLGWGRGLHPEGLDGPRKQEGDGRAPAGIFRLGEAMGYAQDAPEGNRWPYLASADAVCVDDPTSSAYNRIAGPEVPADWRSAEVLARKDALYRWLVQVDHNGLLGGAPPVPGSGSCIFVHVWRAADKGTDGCTAAAEADLTRLLAWLDPAAEPVLVQLPDPALDALRGAWGLP